MSLKVGQYCKIKNDLIINKKYGTVTYTNHIHTNYLGKLLKIQRITSNNTACCYICKDSEIISNEVVGTFSELMLDIPEFEIGKTYTISDEIGNPRDVTITKIDVNGSYKPDSYQFMYYFGKNSMYRLNESTLLTRIMYGLKKQIEENLGLQNLNTINVNGNDKNRLQKQETNLSRRDRFTGRGIQGRTNKVTISSKPLRNPKSIRGK